MRHADHILVIDEQPLRDALVAVLESGGYRVSAARDAVEALAKVDHDRPDLVISGVGMPRGDGFFLLRELRARGEGPRIPILLLSAIAEPERRAAGLELGADDYIARPVEVGELLARVRAHLRRLHERNELRRRALVDALTGVLNRRGIAEALQQRIVEARAVGLALSILMIDLDRFKELNDAHGHACGDTALRQVAHALVAAIRIADHVGRYGGDEFLVVMPGSNADAALALAARLRSLRMAWIAAPDGGSTELRLSIGVATLTEDDCADSLIDRADRAMYGMKRTGELPALR